MPGWDPSEYARQARPPDPGWHRPPLSQPAVDLLAPARKAHAAQLAPQNKAALTPFGQPPQVGQKRINHARTRAAREADRDALGPLTTPSSGRARPPPPLAAAAAIPPQLAATVGDVRSGSRSATRRRSKATTIAPYVRPLHSAPSSTATTRGTSTSGSGRRRIRRSTVSALVGLKAALRPPPPGDRLRRWPSAAAASHLARRQAPHRPGLVPWPACRFGVRGAPPTPAGARQRCAGRIRRCGSRTV